VKQDHTTMLDEGKKLAQDPDEDPQLAEIASAA